MAGGDRARWTIRSGVEDDVGAVLELWLRAEGRPSATDNAQAVGGLLAADPRSLLVAEARGEVVGTLIVGWDGWRGSFYRLAVDPGWRRQGLATALVRAGERQLEELGAARLTAIVADEEDAAAALWASVGYRRQPDTSRFVRMVDGSKA
jgi:ribosomal protein S18 acetylase RimI-like enzyme